MTEPDDDLSTIRGFLAGAIGGTLLWLAAGIILALGWCHHAG